MLQENKPHQFSLSFVPQLKDLSVIIEVYTWECVVGNLSVLASISDLLRVYSAS